MHVSYVSKVPGTAQQSPPIPGPPPTAPSGPGSPPAGRRTAPGRRGTPTHPPARPVPTGSPLQAGSRGTRRRGASPHWRGRSPTIRDPRPGTLLHVRRSASSRARVQERIPAEGLGDEGVRVDLRPLEPAGVVHVHHFDFRVELVHRPSALEVPIAS